MRPRLSQITLLAVLSLWGTVGLCQGQVSSTEVLKTAGVDHGLCIIIGCGDENAPALAAELAASGRMLVHGIALDDGSLARAASAISAAGVDGLATVEKSPLDPLPYRDNLGYSGDRSPTMGLSRRHRIDT
jgi:hypothetical protein